MGTSRVARGYNAEGVCPAECVHARAEGDSLFAVFRRASDAAAAAFAMQQAIEEEPWPTSSPLAVRMALHTGEVDVRDGDYYGGAVNRCARLRSVAHGGQVLLSLAVEQLVRDSLPPDASLLDLGFHGLRDLAQPEHVFQLVHPGLPAGFPPLRSLDAFPNNLPRQVTSFIGREKQMEEVKRLLRGAALLTLTGAGGCGKTRLALQAAVELLEEHPDGAWLVELAPVSEPSQVPQAVAAALGVREEIGRPLTATLAQHLQSRRLLRVLDNCEHLVQAAAQLVSALLRQCPEIRILATSRESLGTAGELSWHVPPLSVPGAALCRLGSSRAVPRTEMAETELEQLLQYEAVRLFIDRATSSQAGFAVTNANAPAVAQICHRLDGIPPAIELAAARVKVLSRSRSPPAWTTASAC